MGLKGVPIGTRRSQGRYRESQGRFRRPQEETRENHGEFQGAPEGVRWKTVSRTFPGNSGKHYEVSEGSKGFQWGLKGSQGPF